MRAFAPRLPLAVAYSGGADSTALLAIASSRWPQEVMAVHVNHGIQEAAADFERHCAAACARFGVPLHVERIDARHEAGESPEDAARRGRYAAIHRVALREGAATVALAQHADDQVETVLLALTRGSGVAGLAGMRAHWQRDGIDYVRPFLSVEALEIRAWLKEQGIAWYDDPTNENLALTRNRIRAAVMPALRESFPAAVDTFARSARHAAQAQELLTQVARDDLARMQGVMDIGALQNLSRERQANVLRHWLKEVHDDAASAAQIEELLDQLAACKTRGHRLQLKVGHGLIERDGTKLRFSSGL